MSGIRCLVVKAPEVVAGLLIHLKQRPVGRASSPRTQVAAPFQYYVHLARFLVGEIYLRFGRRKLICVFMFEIHVKGAPDITGLFNTIAPDITGFFRPRYNRLFSRTGVKSRHIWDNRVLKGRLYLGRESRLYLGRPLYDPHTIARREFSQIYDPQAGNITYSPAGNASNSIASSSSISHEISKTFLGISALKCEFKGHNGGRRNAFEMVASPRAAPPSFPRIQGGPLTYTHWEGQ